MQAEVFLNEPSSTLDGMEGRRALVLVWNAHSGGIERLHHELAEFLARGRAAGERRHDFFVARFAQDAFAIEVGSAAGIGDQPVVERDGRQSHAHRATGFARIKEIKGAFLRRAVQNDHAIHTPPSGPALIRSRDYRTRVFSYDHLPPLRDPIMVVGLTGWVDAGNTSTQLSELLAAQLDATPFADLDLADRIDFSHTRPVLSGLGDERRVSFPRLTCAASSEDLTPNASVVLLTGPELSLDWPTVTTGIVEFARTLGVQRMLSFTGMPSVVSHRRRLPVIAAEFGKRRLAPDSGSVASVQVDYRGPTGLNAVILEAASRADIPAVGVWAQVPIYLASTTSVLGLEALLPVVNTLCEISLDPGAIASRAAFERATVDEKARGDDELQVAIRAADDSDDLGASELIWEIEHFLDDARDHDETDDRSDPNQPDEDTE